MLRRVRRTGSAESGFTLMEVVVSLSIVMVILVAAAGLIVQSLQAATGDARRSKAVSLARDLMEQMKAAPWDRLALATAPPAGQCLGAVVTGPGGFAPTETVTRDNIRFQVGRCVTKQGGQATAGRNYTVTITWTSETGQTATYTLTQTRSPKTADLPNLTASPTPTPTPTGTPTPTPTPTVNPSQTSNTGGTGTTGLAALTVPSGNFSFSGTCRPGSGATHDTGDARIPYTVQVTTVNPSQQWLGDAWYTLANTEILVTLTWPANFTRGTNDYVQTVSQPWTGFTATQGTQTKVTRQSASHTFRIGATLTATTANTTQAALPVATSGAPYSMWIEYHTARGNGPLVAICPIAAPTVPAWPYTYVTTAGQAAPVVTGTGPVTGTATCTWSNGTNTSAMNFGVTLGDAAWTNNQQQSGWVQFDLDPAPGSYLATNAFAADVGLGGTVTWSAGGGPARTAGTVTEVLLDYTGTTNRVATGHKGARGIMPVETTATAALTGANGAAAGPVTFTLTGTNLTCAPVTVVLGAAGVSIGSATKSGGAGPAAFGLSAATGRICPTDLTGYVDVTLVGTAPGDISQVTAQFLTDPVTVFPLSPVAGSTYRLNLSTIAGTPAGTADYRNSVVGLVVTYLDTSANSGWVSDTFTWPTAPNAC